MDRWHLPPCLCPTVQEDVGGTEGTRERKIPGPDGLVWVISSFLRKGQGGLENAQLVVGETEFGPRLPEADSTPFPHSCELQCCAPLCVCGHGAAWSLQTSAVMGPRPA